MRANTKANQRSWDEGKRVERKKGSGTAAPCSTSGSLAFLERLLTASFQKKDKTEKERKGK